MKASDYGRNDFVELLNDQFIITAPKNHYQRVLRKILKSILFLARQSLQFRGNWTHDSESEADSNFH